MASGGTTRVRSLDGLRGVAVLLVLGVHAAGSKVPGGSRGVDVFFVLSGFLITGLLLAEWDRSGSISLREFYARRALRLLPALLTVLLFVAVVPRLLAEVGQVAELLTWRDIWGPLLYVHNWVNIVHHDEPSMMTHAWSLAVEEQFYVLWPLVLIAVLPLARTRRVVGRVLVAAILLAAAQMAVRFAAGVDYIWLYDGTESHGAVMLLAGAAVAFWWSKPHHRVGAGVRWARRCWPIAAALLAVMVFGLPHAWSGYFYGGWLVVAAVVVCLLVAALSGASVLTAALSNPILVWFGTISYGLYLWHLPFWYLLRFAFPDWSSTLVAAVAIPAAVAAAAASFYGMERPVQRWGRARLAAATRGGVARREDVAV